MFRTVPEDRLHHLIREACQLHRDEESVYRHIQREFGGIKPLLADLTHALPSLVRQKQEMTRQTLQLLGERRDVHRLRRDRLQGPLLPRPGVGARIKGPCYFIDEQAPTFSPADIMERGQIARLGHAAAAGRLRAAAPTPSPTRAWTSSAATSACTT